MAEVGAAIQGISKNFKTQIIFKMLFNYLRRVYLGDTDAAGVVYFAKGMEMCHEAYEESLAAAGVSIEQMLRMGKLALPITHAEINFFRPLKCGDRLNIQLTAKIINSSEFAIAYDISQVGNLTKTLVKATTRHVCINPLARVRTDLPASILSWLDS